MNNQKTVKSANSEKGAVLYIVTCALVVIQPLLDILSSIVINLGKANYISVSGAVRAVIIAAVTVSPSASTRANTALCSKFITVSPPHISR